MPPKAKTTPDDPTVVDENKDQSTTQLTDEERLAQHAKLVEDVLWGRYGDHGAARKQLTEAGHDATAVLASVNQRIATGAPSAYKPTAVGLIQQVKDGEWGDRRGLAQRLRAAGFGQPAVTEVMNNIERE